jgi:galactokinase
MTGAGFGGVCVALVESSRMQRFAQEAADGYRAKTAIEPEIIPCQAADGARIVALTL